jgi:hypothetical protein
MFVGKMERQVGRKMMGEWTSLSGHDAHSVEQPIKFHDAATGDFRAVNVLTWALDRTATGGWGIAEFSGVKSPAQDVNAAPYSAFPDAGCYATHANPSRPPDGKFTVNSRGGITSAGIFSHSGREIAYLFHNLPLVAGEHQFWFPSRDFEGKPIPPGEYEVRTVESALNWQYLGMVGNNGLETPIGASAAVGTAKIAFDSNGQLLAGCDGWAENFVNLRAYDAKTGAWHWAFHAPADVRGLAAGADGAAYALRRTGQQERLTRVDPRTGKVSPWPRLTSGELYLHTGADATGMAELDDRLFFIDGSSGKLYSSPTGEPNFSPIATIPGIASLSADAAHHNMWAIGKESHVIAVSPAGKIIADATPVASACALAACNGRLAVASKSSGKIELFDCSDPAHLKPLVTVGRGDGPYGAFAPDRFTFQRADNLPGNSPVLALGPDGELAVADLNRLSVFDSSGKNLWYTFGIFGSGAVPNYSDRSRLFESDGNWSFRLDEKHGSWKPEGLWRQPALAKGSLYLGDFSIGGKAFGVYQTAYPKYGPNQGLLVVRLEDFKQVPVLAIQYDENQKAHVIRKDTNHDGRIDDADAGQIFAKVGELFYAYSRVQPNGDIHTLDGFGTGNGLKVLRCAGLDADGVPIYKFEIGASSRSRRMHRSSHLTTSRRRRMSALAA